MEAVCNRLHEVRVRFEVVLLRDAMIEWLEGLLPGGNPDQLEEAFVERSKQLQTDYVFVCDCNVNAESFGPDKVERLHVIAARQAWVRHFDGGLGLACEEHERRAVELPMLFVKEHLLADQPWHLIPRNQMPP